MALLIDPHYFPEDNIEIEDDFYDYGDQDEFYDGFRSLKRKRPFSHYRGIAPKNRKRKFRTPTRGKAPDILISPERLRKLRLQQSKKKSTKPSGKAKPKAKKIPVKPQKQNSDTAKMAAHKKAMASDSKSAKPMKAIVIVAAITGTAVLGYLVWKQHKKKVF